MDMQLIPLKVDLYVIIKIEVDLLFSTITKVIFEKLLWAFTSPTINMNIFNLNNAEPDDTGPAFDWYSKAVSVQSCWKSRMCAVETQLSATLFTSYLYIIQTSLSHKLLVDIHRQLMGHLLYMQQNLSYLEPYLPSLSVLSKRISSHLHFQVVSQVIGWHTYLHLRKPPICPHTGTWFGSWSFYCMIKIYEQIYTPIMIA